MGFLREPFANTSVKIRVAQRMCAPHPHFRVAAFFFWQGCYIGQESISRVNAYGAVKNALYGVSFEESASPEEGTALYDAETGKRQVAQAKLLLQQ